MQLGLLHQLGAPSLSCTEKQCLPDENTLYTPPSLAIHKENGHHTFKPKEMRETPLIITSLRDGSLAIHCYLPTSISGTHGFRSSYPCSTLQPTHSTVMSTLSPPYDSASAICCTSPSLGLQKEIIFLEHP